MRSGNNAKFGPAYSTARQVAELIRPRLEHHIKSEQAIADQSPMLSPSIADIEGMIDAAFWASLRREEGYVPKISAAFLSPEATHDPLRFEQPVPFTPDALARLAPAVERAGVHLGVWRRDNVLQVWGTTTTIPKYCFV